MKHGPFLTGGGRREGGVIGRIRDMALEKDAKENPKQKMKLQNNEN